MPKARGRRSTRKRPKSTPAASPHATPPLGRRLLIYKPKDATWFINKVAKDLTPYKGCLGTEAGFRALTSALGDFEYYLDKEGVSLGSMRSISALAVASRILVSKTHKLASRNCAVKELVEDNINNASLPENMGDAYELAKILAKLSLPQRNLPGAHPYDRKWAATLPNTTEEMIDALQGGYMFQMTRMGFPEVLCQSLAETASGSMYETLESARKNPYSCQISDIIGDDSEDECPPNQTSNPLPKRKGVEQQAEQNQQEQPKVGPKGPTAEEQLRHFWGSRCVILASRTAAREASFLEHKDNIKGLVDFLYPMAVANPTLASSRHSNTEGKARGFLEDAIVEGFESSLVPAYTTDKFVKLVLPMLGATYQDGIEWEGRVRDAWKRYWSLE